MTDEIDTGPAFFKDQKERASYQKIMFPLHVLHNEDGVTPCEIDPDTWWSDWPETIQKAKELCDTCPVKAACAEWSIRGHEKFGVWGGMSAQDRSAVQSFNKRNTTHPVYTLEQKHSRHNKLMSAAIAGQEELRKHNKKSFDVPELPDPVDPGIPAGIEPDDIRHGMAWFYNDRKYKCRCQKCTAAKQRARHRSEARARALEGDASVEND